MTLDEIRAIGDPAQRARAAQAFLERGTEALATVRGIRDEAVWEWRKAATQREIAADLGVTPGLIGQIDARRSTYAAQRMPKDWTPPKGRA